MKKAFWLAGAAALVLGDDLEDVALVVTGCGREVRSDDPSQPALLAPPTTALLMMECQEGIIGSGGALISTRPTSAPGAGRPTARRPSPATCASA